MTNPTHAMTNSNPLGEHEKQCPQCERIFVTDDLRIVYCSQICKSRANAQPRSSERKADKHEEEGEFTHICKECEKQFQSHSKRAVYCSEACRVKAANARMYQRNRENVIKRSIENRNKRKSQEEKNK